MELFRWSISHQLDMHSCQIRALIQFRKRGQSPQKRIVEKENNFQRHLLKAKQFTLRGHYWSFMLYTGKGTLLKQGVLREKENFSLFHFLNNSQNPDYLVLRDASFKIFIETLLDDKKFGIPKKKKKIICPKGLLKTFTYFCLVIKIINVHRVLQIAKSIKAKFLKYCVRNC